MFFPNFGKSLVFVQWNRANLMTLFRDPMLALEAVGYQLSFTLLLSLLTCHHQLTGILPILSDYSRNGDWAGVPNA